MYCKIEVDENIKKIVFKSWLIVEDALEKGNISIQTQKSLAARFLDLLKHGDPLCEQLIEIACHRHDDKDFKGETLSPDDKAAFQKILTSLENGELEI